MKNEIIGIAKGVEASLVLIKSNDQLLFAIENNKHITPNPKICLVSSPEIVKHFFVPITKDLDNHTRKNGSVISTLTCNSFCEVLNVYKINRDTFEFIMYYNYRRPKSKSCVDSVCLRTHDLEQLVNIQL